MNSKSKQKLMPKIIKFYETIRNWLKKCSPSELYILAGVLLVCVFAYSVNFRIHARDTGGMIGENTGKLVGRAVGSFDGLTEGRREGYKAGKEEGLSAKDTTAELAGKIQEAVKLEVLIASGTYSDVIIEGDNHIDYAALLSQKYNAVFTVDLTTADIELKDDGLHILLDQPVVEFITEGDIEKKNEFQRHGFIVKPGSADDGYNAANNSINEISEKAQERLQNDESMMATARSSAKTQLVQLVNAVSLTKPEVYVEFRGGVDNG